MTTKETINVPGAPKAKGPYSHAVKSGGFIFISGQLPVNPENEEIVSGSIEDAARQTLDNLKTVIEGAGGKMANVVKTSCYLSDMDDFQAFNSVYAEYFKEDEPARACVQPGRLPLDVLLEVEAIVAVGD